MVCEGLAFAVVDRGQSPREGLLEAKRALRETFGPRLGWRVTPLGATVKEYIASPPRVPHELPLAPAWEQARRLSEHPLVVDAEPSLRGPGVTPVAPRAAMAPGERDRLGAAIPTRVRAALGGAALQCSEPSEWSLVTARVRDAWAAFPARGRDIRVGHPDTGYTEHDEIWSDDPAQNRIAGGFDFLEGDAIPWTTSKAVSSSSPGTERPPRA